LSEAENANEKTEFDPTRAEQVNERLSLIYQFATEAPVVFSFRIC